MLDMFSNFWNWISGIPAEATGSVAVLVVGWILKAIPNEKLQSAFYKFMYGVGVAITVGASKSKVVWVQKLWKNTIEAYIIDAVDNIGIHGLKGFVAGLRSDNK